MCLHISKPEKEKELADNQGLTSHESYQQVFNLYGYTHPFLPVRLNNSQIEIHAGKLQLLPDSVRTKEEAANYKPNTLNTKGETLFNTFTYRAHAGLHRGLLYEGGFFESDKPLKVVAKNGDFIKKTDIKALSENYYVHRPNKQKFTLGIIYSPFVDKQSGEFYNTFSIIAIPATELLLGVNNEKKCHTG